MKQLFKEYAKIFSYTITGMVFVFASFYLIINIYHYEEVRDTFLVNMSEDSNYSSVETKIANISKYTNVDINKRKGKADKTFLSNLQSKLNYCNEALANDEFKELKEKKELSIKDVYNLRNALNAKVINGCLVEQLNYLTYYDDKDGSSGGLTNYSEMIKLNIDTISTKLNYIDKDLLNNSSYYYTTTTTKASVMNKPQDMFNDLMTTYDEASSLVETLSKWLYEEVGVSND